MTIFKSKLAHDYFLVKSLEWHQVRILTTINSGTNEHGEMIEFGLKGKDKLRKITCLQERIDFN